MNKSMSWNSRLAAGIVVTILLISVALFYGFTSLSCSLFGCGDLQILDHSASIVINSNTGEKLSFTVPAGFKFLPSRPGVTIFTYWDQLAGYPQTNIGPPVTAASRAHIISIEPYGVPKKPQNSNAQPDIKVTGTLVNLKSGDCLKLPGHEGPYRFYFEVTFGSRPSTIACEITGCSYEITKEQEGYNYQVSFRDDQLCNWPKLMQTTDSFVARQIQKN